LSRASFAAGIAAVRRERRKRGKMTGRDDILEVSQFKGIFLRQYDILWRFSCGK
jgi:hypothetical protein